MAPTSKLATGVRSDALSGSGARPSLDFLPLLCAAVALLCILFVTVSLGSHEWIQGTVLRDGKPVEAFVGLSSVTIGGTKSAFGKLCPKGTPHAIPAHFTDTPPAVWCKCQSAGTAGNWLIWLAYVPLWVACLLSAVEGLAAVDARARSIKAQLGAMGLANPRVLIGFWAVSWVCLFLGLLAYAGAAPDSLGWGTVHFEASFGLARLSFLLVTICTAAITAKLLRLWHEENFGEALGDFTESRGIRRALYLTLFAQLVRARACGNAVRSWMAAARAARD